MLPIKTFQTINAAEQNLQFIQRNVQNALNPVLGTAILDGVLVQNMKIPSSGQLNVGHNLGRAPQGYFVVSSTGAYSPPYSVTSEQLTPNTQLVLHFTTGAGSVVSIWVF